MAQLYRLTKDNAALTEKIRANVFSAIKSGRDSFSNPTIKEPILGLDPDTMMPKFNIERMEFLTQIAGMLKSVERETNRLLTEDQKFLLLAKSNPAKAKIDAGEQARINLSNTRIFECMEDTGECLVAAIFTQGDAFPKKNEVTLIPKPHAPPVGADIGMPRKTKL